MPPHMTNMAYLKKGDHQHVPGTWDYTYEPKTWEYTYEPKTWEYTYEPNTYETVAPVASNDMHPDMTHMAYLEKDDRKHNNVETRDYTYAPLASVPGTWDY